MLTQALLINRSPRLEDLTTEAFARLREHPQQQRRHAEMLYALQKVAADLGYCDPPSARRNHAPAIEAPARSGPSGSSGGTPPRR